MSHNNVLNCLKCSLLAISLLLLQPGYTQHNFDDLDGLLKANQKSLGTNLVAMVWKGDSLVFKKELGDFNSKTAAPLGDASRWLTAALVMQFIDEGKLSLDDKISKWIPEYERYGKNYITIRYCLANMTGIEDESKSLKKIFQKKKFSSLEDEVNSYAAREIRVNAGLDFWYGNIGANIAGRVLEVISKKRFDQLIKQKLFTPLALRKTSFSNLDGGAVSPANGAQSSADDYIKFLVMLLNKGKYQGKQILSEASVNAMETLQTKPEMMKSSPKILEGLGYGLGVWILSSNNGKTTSFASPALGGPWPVVDRCRGYAYLLFPKELISEEKATINTQLKALIDQQLPESCQ
jgi:CubicO group peptidase (beta-lactamase class C family)